MNRLPAEDHPYIRQVVHRAMKDRDFRERLKQNAKVAIKEETGIEIPDDVEIRFTERFGRRRLRVITSLLTPDEEEELEEEDEEELSLEDLEEAAGGSGGDPPDDPESPW